MAGVVRKAALEALAAVIRDATDGAFSDHAIHVEDAEPDVEACWPNLVLNTMGSFSFEPFDADDVEGTATTATVHVGDFSGRVRIRLGAKYKPERTKIGEAILQEFLKTPGKPGVLVVYLSGLQVGAVTLASDIPVAFRLDSTEWEEEMVFERKRFQDLAIEVEIPALVTWEQTYDINNLVVAFTEDLTSDDPAYTQVAVTETGTLEEYP